MRSACVFVCKVQGPRAREMVVLAGDGVSQFFLRIFGWRRTLADASQPKIFSHPNGDRPVPIGQKRSDVRNLLKLQISKRSKPVRGWLTANVQKKKYFCFSNRLFLQSRSPRVGRVGRCVFTITVFGMRFFLCKHGVNEEKEKRTSECRIRLGRGADVREGRTKRGTRGAD